MMEESPLELDFVRDCVLLCYYLYSLVIAYPFVTVYIIPMLPLLFIYVCRLN